jgi:hypothetical protein
MKIHSINLFPVSTGAWRATVEVATDFDPAHRMTIQLEDWIEGSSEALDSTRVLDHCKRNLKEVMDAEVSSI